MEKKALFIISLKYPLINAINIKVNLLKNKNSDIILDDNQADIFDIAKRLESLNIFDNVYIVRGNSLRSIKYIFKGNKNISVSKAINNTLVNIKNKILRLINKEKFIESMKLYGGNIDLSQYDEMYLCSETEVSIACSDLLVKKYGFKSINLIEEGVRDYYTDVSIMKYCNLYSNVEINVYLYDINLPVYKLRRKNIVFKSIPKLDENLIELKNIFNKIFKYNNIKNWDNKIIMFEQVSEPLPDYLLNINKIEKFFLNNAYKKHLKEHICYEIKCDAIEKVLSLLSNRLIKSFYIKVHPRTKNGILDKHKKYIIGDKKNFHNIPWEVYMINEKFNNNIWITINSSSIFNRLICFNNIPRNMKIIILNEIFCINTQSSLKQLFFNIAKVYKRDVIIPKTIDEFENNMNTIIKNI